MWERVIEAYGSQEKAADAVGVSRPAISYHVAKGTPVPAEWCRTIEEDTGIPRHVLRPDLWTREMFSGKGVAA